MKHLIALIFLLALCLSAFGQTGSQEINDWARMGGLEPYAWYIPYQSDIPPGSMHFLIQADQDGIANIIFPSSGGFRVGVQLVATATPSPVQPTPTKTPTVTPTKTNTPTPTATFTPSPTPTRPNALAPGSWTDLFQRVQALWAAQKAWDEKYGGNQ